MGKTMSAAQCRENGNEEVLASEALLSGKAKQRQWSIAEDNILVDAIRTEFNDSGRIR
jgi:hypothetical protein